MKIYRFIIIIIRTYVLIRRAKVLTFGMVLSTREINPPEKYIDHICL